MPPAAEDLPRSTAQSLLDAQLELWHHTFSYIKSMALKSALDLHIADTIHHHGGTATLSQIVTKITLHQSKFPYLRGACSQSLVLMLDGVFVSPFFRLGEWLQRELPEPSLFEAAHGQKPWDLANGNPSFGVLFNEGMVADSSFIIDIVVKECGDVFQGLSSLIDVAGGLGGAAQAIAKAFPHVTCSVLDLPHVVANAPTGTGAKYIAGDMFESVPPANAAFLKWVLHDWGDAECVKILKNCKQAIPPKDAGGKVIILDMVVEAGPSNGKHKETQVLFDLMIMVVNGIERDEQEWKKVIIEAGFSDYKIIPVLGV
ncbi:hypothetical protein EJB05_36804, partial [Eragrostis curvula]